MQRGQGLRADCWHGYPLVTVVSRGGGNSMRDRRDVGVSVGEEFKLWTSETVGEGGIWVTEIIWGFV